jgi:hypothetical protein
LSWSTPCGRSTPGEAPEPALEAVVAVVRDLLRLLAVGRDGQRVVLHLDRDLLLGNAGEVEGVHDVGLGLPDIERRDPRLGRRTPGLSGRPFIQRLISF